MTQPNRDDQVQPEQPPAVTDGEAGRPKTYAEICTDKKLMGERIKQLKAEWAELESRIAAAERETFEVSVSLDAARRLKAGARRERDAAVARAEVAESNLDAVLDVLITQLNRLPNYPCRVDEMTDREIAISKVASHMIAAADFAIGKSNSGQSILDELRQLRDFLYAARKIVCSQDANDITAQVLRNILRDKGLLTETGDR